MNSQINNKNHVVKNSSNGCIKAILILFGVVVCLIILLIIYSAIFGKSSEEIKEEKIQSKKEQILNAEKKQINENAQLYNNIVDKIDYLKEFKREGETVDYILTQIELYKKLYTQSEYANIDSINIKAQELKNESIKFQVKYFPIIRKEYSSKMNSKMWEFDVKVNCSGSKNEKLTYIGGMFAANRNVKETYEAMYDDVVRMRFKEVNFKWIPSADEWEYFTINGKKDNEF